MDEKFNGRIAVVTGAGRGLGAAYAKILAGHRVKVLLTSASAACQHVADEINRLGGTACALPGNIADAGFCRQLIDTAVAKWGSIDILINNAGNRPDASRDVATMDDTYLNAVLNVHLHGTFNTIVAAWKYMRARQYGRIVNTSSSIIFGAEGMAYDVPHAAAKGAVAGITKMLGREGERFGIKVNAVMPVSLEANRSGPDSEQDARLLAQVYRALGVREREPLENIARSVAFLAHDDVPCSGELFSVCNNRIARVFFGEAPGVRVADNTLANIGKAFAAIMDTDGYCIPDLKMDTALAIGLDLDALLERDRREHAAAGH